ncbi:hypothetical protein R3W88_012025 [Solanum pinnatisectum]|uniref:Uncharacterized protein n=1 Tax=Solanum pinnatisectum TaxID=50273 RepID=A0AAV9L7R7_9SOLN|nr:hypothetical protein R3W88_012025 [Solanum pinnatisectum]
MQSITYLRKLTNLQLYENFFCSSLVNDIGVLTKLEILDVANNKLSGSIPSSTTSLRSLTRLDLSNNELTGKIPQLNGINKGIFMLPELSHISISRNRFTVFEVTGFHGEVSTWNIITGGIGSSRAQQTLEGFSGSFEHNCLICPKGLQCHGQRMPCNVMEETIVS